MYLDEEQVENLIEEAKAHQAAEKWREEGAKAFSYGFIGGGVSSLFWLFIIFVIFVSLAMGG